MGKFTWNFEVRLLGYYVLLVVIFQIYGALGGGPAAWGFPRLELLLWRTTGFAWVSASILEAAWLVTMAVLMIAGKPLLRTYVAVESILTLPEALFVIGLLLAGPSFHTGSREQQLEMLYIVILLWIVPISLAWLLWRTRTAAAKGSEPDVNLSLNLKS